MCSSDLFSDNYIQVLEWPAQSPDINPIEHLWYYIKSQLLQYEIPKECMSCGRVWWRGGYTTKGMPKPNRKHAQEDHGSYLGKRWSYKVLNSKIIEIWTNCPNEWQFCLVLYFMGFNLNYMTQIPNSSQDVVVYGTINNATLNYVSIPYQKNLWKTSKHWGSFLSHCTVSNDILV